MKVLFLCVLLACLAFCMTRAEMDASDVTDVQERKSEMETGETEDELVNRGRSKDVVTNWDDTEKIWHRTSRGAPVARSEDHPADRGTNLGFVELEERAPAKKPASKRCRRSDDDNLAFAEDIARRARTKQTARQH